MTTKTSDILGEFEEAFKKASHFIRSNISKPIRRLKGSRNGDFVTQLDSLVFSKFFDPIALRHKMLRVCEEDFTEFSSNEILSSQYLKSEYLLVLDSIDGTVNMLHDLPFGMNLSFGKIDKAKDSFVIGDLDAAFVGDYLSLKSYSWIRGGETVINDAIFQGMKFRKNLTDPATVYEVPDEASYVHTKNAVKNQQALLALFRKAFESYQRRSLDCTGTRMLEVLDRNLAAYGDVRRATRIWDTIPSIRILLENREIAVLNKDFEPITLKTHIMEKSGGLWRFVKGIGESVIVLHKDAKGRLLKFRKDKAQDKIKPKVFIVHGRDENTLHEVKDYLQNSLKLGKPLILNEKPFLGRTIIEKFEKYARQANLIFVILTPDDKMAKESDDKESKLHARQNVILELGYFYGKIGRLEGRVILLYKGKRKGKIDIPTDLSGVGYIDISDGIAGKESDTRIREEIHQFLS